MSESWDITLVTCAELPEPDPDARPLEEALEARGLTYRWAAWTDETVDWSASPVALIRSTWDYYHDRAAYVDWAHQTDLVTTLLNSASVVQWNSSKLYLLDLGRAGVPIIPTVLVPRATETALSDILSVQGWNDVVIKPVVGAGSHHTHLLRAGDAPTDEQLALFKTYDMLVQPYIASVESYGERSLVYIDGELSHVARKHPRFAQGEEQVTGPHEATDEERAVAEQAIEEAPFNDLLYARIDLVRDENDSPLLSEFEAMEPSLFFRMNPECLERYIDGIIARRDAHAAAAGPDDDEAAEADA